MLDAIIIVIGVFAALGIGAWLEQGGKSKDEDYDDEDYGP